MALVNRIRKLIDKGLENWLDWRFRRALKPGQTLVKYDEFPGLRIISQLNEADDVLLANIKSAIARELPEVWPHKAQDTEVAVVCGGPSLLDTMDELKELAARGIKILCLANTTHVLLEHGVYPISAQLVLDASERNATFLHDIPGCTYFAASQCHPAVFDKLATFKGEADPKTGHPQSVYVWHAINNSEEMQAVVEGLGKPWCRVLGGSTIAFRAMQLLKILGFSNYHLFGFDSCMQDGAHHAYDQPRADASKAHQISCNGRDFAVQGWMLNQAMEFIRFVKAQGDDMRMKIYGNGLIAHMVRSVAEKAKEAA